MKKIKVAKHERVKHLDKNEEDPLDRDMTEFVANADWRPFSDFFQFAPKNQTITLRMSDALLKEYKKLAKNRKIKYQKLIREALIEYLNKTSTKKKKTS